MEKTQAVVALSVLAAPALDVEARNDTNKLLKPRNPDLYYSSLHIKCYNFCQQCEDYFEVVG